MSSLVIPIHRQPDAATADAPHSCGACHHSSAGPVCRVGVAPGHAGPELRGDPATLARVMAALRQDLAALDDDERSLGADELVHALHLQDGEAELVLAVAQRCGGVALADQAFQTLRRLLPDTDLYVRHLVADEAAPPTR